jgi:hypothetical protein
MKNITVSVTDLQHRRIHTWAAQRNCSASFLVRRFIEDLPKVARALQVINSYELDRMGIRPTPENRALVDLLRPAPRNKKLALSNPETKNSRKHPEKDQAVAPTRPKNEASTIDCGRMPKNTSTRRLILNSLPEPSTPVPASQSANRPMLPSSAADRAADMQGDT